MAWFGHSSGSCRSHGKTGELSCIVVLWRWPGLAFSASTTLAAGPLDAFNGLKGNLDIAGGTAHIPVMKGAAKQIMAANPDIRITVAGGGSGVGVQKAGEGLAQIGNTGRALKESEIKKYGLVSFPFAIDGVAVAVNPKKSGLRTEQSPTQRYLCR